MRGGTRPTSARRLPSLHFNPPTSCGVGLCAPPFWVLDGEISIHPPRAGWDMKQSRAAFTSLEFQSTHPVRGGTNGKRCTAGKRKFQSTHPVRGGTTFSIASNTGRNISIHPPRAGWDVTPDREWHRPYISIHPPRAGWDPARLQANTWSRYFNPPTPCGVGQYPERDSVSAVNFNPPTPCGVGRQEGMLDHPLDLISIHPPRAGWDATCCSAFSSA